MSIRVSDTTRFTVAIQELSLAAERRQPKRRGHFSRAFARLMRKKIAFVCMVTLLVLYGGSALANWIAPYDYTAQDYSSVRQAPSIVTDQGIGGFFTKSHFAGTDRLGRDLFTRVLWGIQNTMLLTIVAMATGGLFIGVTLGLLSGYLGGRVDSIIMRTGEVTSSFPDIFLVIIIAATLRPRILDWVRWLEDNTVLDGLVRSGVADYVVISIALVSFSWFGAARLLRAQVLTLKATQFVESARAIGASTPRILFVHLLPNAIGPMVITVTAGMGSMVGAEIILSWLGLGIQPPRPSLGVMLLQGGHISVLRNEYWMLLAPGIAAWIMVLSWNLLGDSLYDVLNPRTR